MPKSDQFIRKILNRIERIDRSSLEAYLKDLAKESQVYKEILEEIEEGVIVIRDNGTIRFLNRQAAFCLGIDRPVTDRDTLFDWINDTELAAFIRKNIPAAGDKVIQNIHLLSPREITLRASIKKLKGSSTEEYLILLIPVMENLSSWNERLSRIESLVKLAAGIAHEIGNPLNSVGIHLQLLEKEVEKLPEPKHKKIKNTIDVIKAETKRLDKIIRTFLKATRKPPLRFKLENLNEIAQAALDFQAPALKKNNITVIFQGDKGLPHFMMDRERIYQAFLNLINNAMEAMPKKGRLQILVSHKEQVAIARIKDSGEGITEKDLPHIFDAYYTTKKEGSGLGLMTVFDTVREHGGKIEVNSQVGKGTVFTLLFPIRIPQRQISHTK